MDASRYHSLRVREVINETPDACSIWLEVPEAQRDAFAYRPGQFLTVRLPAESEAIQRCYSLSSTPGLDGDLRITVKRVTGGLGSNWICDALAPGERLESLAPAGRFVADTPEGDFLLFAGGSGITPVLSILRAALAEGHGRVCLVFANRDERSVIFADLLRELQGQYPERLQVIHLLDSVQGPPRREQLMWLARPWWHAQVFICGPGPFMAAVEEAMGALGVPPERVRLERFVSPPSRPAALASATPASSSPAEAVAPAAPAASEGGSEVSVTLNGETLRFQCRADETLIEAAERQGILLPSACQAGMCATCMCRVEEGEVVLQHNDVLDERDLARGMTLSCQAQPASPRLVLKFL
jgi:3-ketosteroid 9alpha-monooxygenase subunit B